MPQIRLEKGERITLHFSLSLADGMLVDTSREGDPLVVIVGEGDMVEGLEQRLLGMSTGERRRFDIPANEIYGPPDPDAIHTFAREEFSPEMRLEPGLVVGFALPSGEEVPALVLAVDEQGVQVDFSHPLAGHGLIFEVEILAVEQR